MLLKKKRVNLLLNKDDLFSSLFPRLFAAFRHTTLIIYPVSVESLHSKVQIWYDHYLSSHF